MVSCVAMVRDQPSRVCTPATRISSRVFGELVVQTVTDGSPAGGNVLPDASSHRITLVTGGAMRLERRETAGGRWTTRTLGSGDLHMSSVGSPGYEIRWTSVSSQPLELVHLHLDPRLTLRVAREHGAALSNLEISTPWHSRDPLIDQIARGLARAVSQPRPSDSAFAEHAAELLGIHLLREHSSLRPESGLKHAGLLPRKLRIVQEFVAAHIGAPLPLTELARQAGLSTYHFARAFKQATGETPHRYVLRCRIEAAQRLLSEGRGSLSQVAQAVGFASQAHFTTQFRQATGITPARWLRRR